MTFEQRNTWVAAIVQVAAYLTYVLVVLGRAGGQALTEVAYVAPLLWTIGTVIVASIVGIIGTTIAAAIKAEITNTKFSDTTDERDKAIGQRGEFVGYYVLGFGALAALAMAMGEIDHFWIANAIYLMCVVSNLTASIVKIVVYRRGF